MNSLPLPGVQTMINYGGELIRISPKDNKKIKYSQGFDLDFALH